MTDPSKYTAEIHHSTKMPFILLKEPIGIKNGRVTSVYTGCDQKVAKDGFKVDAKWHGEYIQFATDGHKQVHYFYNHGSIVADFKNDLITDKEKFILKLTYSGEWLAD